MRLVDIFERTAHRYPDRVFLEDSSTSLTYKDVYRFSKKLSQGFNRRINQKTLHVAVYSSNSAISFACVFGILDGNNVWVPINVKNSTDVNAYILSNCDVDVLIFDEEYLDEIEKLKSVKNSIKHYICIQSGCCGYEAIDDYLDENGTISNSSHYNDSDPTIFFSSGGTTGKPKGVIWTHNVVETMLANYYASFCSADDQRHLVVAPLTHAAGVITLLLAASGTSNYILKSTQPSQILSAIEDKRITHLFLPPTVIYMLLESDDINKYNYDSLKYFIYSAAPMSVEKLRKCITVFGPVMTQVYGQAEAPLMCTFLSPQDHLRDGELSNTILKSCGKETLFTPVDVMDEAGNIVEPGEVGEIVVKGGLVMDGYYNNPTASLEVQKNGWHCMGDLGYKDREGYIYLVDRKRDMIISGGFNIYPGEIEQVLWSHPAVQDCAVVGVPDKKWGEAVKAIIELYPDKSVSERELMALCKEKLGSVKAPKTVEFWDSIPRTSVGKVSKKTIREMFWKSEERAI